MGHHDLYSVLINGMLHHIRNLQPFTRRDSAVSDHHGESLECKITMEYKDSESSEIKIVVECNYSIQTPNDITDDDDQFNLKDKMSYH